MIVQYNFGISLKEYECRGKNNRFPIFERCPNCHCLSGGNLQRNGFYWRYGITEEDGALYIPICRLRCLVCKVNISILPDFLIPYFQSTLHTIVNRINRVIQRKYVGRVDRQLIYQHRKRFLECLEWIHSFFVDLGYHLTFSKRRKKEALKYMIMILDTGISSFFRKSWGHLSSYFMGKLILPYISNNEHIIIPT